MNNIQKAFYDVYCATIEALDNAEEIEYDVILAGWQLEAFNEKVHEYQYQSEPINVGD